MTRIDFYVLEPHARGDYFQLACRIAFKAYQMGSRVILHTTHEQTMRHLDRLLWVFNEQSFIPHGLLGEVDATLNPVLIGNAESIDNEHEVFINLDLPVPPTFSRYERLVECVDHTETIKHASRERYKFYRDRGYPLNLHKIK